MSWDKHFADGIRYVALTDILNAPSVMREATQEERDGVEQYINSIAEECGDCISRQAAIDACLNGWNKDYKEIVEEIRALPPVTPAEKVGQWIIKDGREQGYDIGGTKTWYIQMMCDKCGFIKTAIEGHMGQYKFCPNCGQSKMQEV